MVVDGEGAKSLRMERFGKLRRRRLVLSPCESLYLIEKGRIEVVDELGGKLSFSDVLNFHRSRNPNLWLRYLVYRDLLNRGYQVMMGDENIDFYVQHKPDKKVFAVIRLQEGESVLTGKLMRMISKVKESRKGLVLAVIDRRSEVVYYSLKEASI